MNGYLLFSGESHEPLGGAGDLVGFYLTIDECKAKIAELKNTFWCDWYHALNMKTLKVELIASDPDFHFASLCDKWYEQPYRLDIEGSLARIECVELESSTPIVEKQEQRRL